MVQNIAFQTVTLEDYLLMGTNRRAIKQFHHFARTLSQSMDYHYVGLNNLLVKL